jgi:hypothetical protein
MLASIVYGYLDNMQFLFASFDALIIAGMIGLGIARATNNVDRDDWAYLMLWLTPTLVVFSCMICVPSLDKVKEINETLYPTEKPNESNPNVSASFSIDCNGLRTK